MKITCVWQAFAKVKISLKAHRHGAGTLNYNSMSVSCMTIRMPYTFKLSTHYPTYFAPKTYKYYTHKTASYPSCIRGLLRLIPNYDEATLQRKIKPHAL